MWFYNYCRIFCFLVYKLGLVKCFVYYLKVLNLTLIRSEKPVKIAIVLNSSLTYVPLCTWQQFHYNGKESNCCNLQCFLLCVSLYTVPIHHTWFVVGLIIFLIMITLLYVLSFLVTIIFKRPFYSQLLSRGYYLNASQ